jgi:4-hydroxybenzoate polyprenyltransferase
MNASIAPGAAGSSGAWMRLMRLSNAPTAATGALVGAMIATRGTAGAATSASTLGLCVAGVTLLYLGGMVMNDFFDQPIDRIERPDRPIVSGRVSAQAALSLGMLLLAAGTAALLVTSTAAVPWVLLLLSCVLAYNLLHRSAIAGPLLMACCRALVPVITAIACTTDTQPDWALLALFAVPLGLYTFGISLVARGEAAASGMSGRSWTLPLATSLAAVSVLAPLGSVALRLLPPLGLQATAGYLLCIALAAWLLLRGLGRMVHPRGVPAGVMSWIAGFAAIDAGSLVLLRAPSLSVMALFALALTLSLQRRIAGS